MIRRILLPLLFLAVAAPARAQGEGSIHLLAGLPQGAFAERTGNALGIGLGGQLLYRAPGTPLAVGAELGFLIYGQETFRDCLVSCRVQVDVVTTNNVALGHLLLRVQPPRGVVRPYADAFFGLNYLFTESRIEDVDRNRPELASQTNFDDLAFSFGAAGGTQVTVFRGVSAEGTPYELALDARLRYVRGGEANYLRRGSITEQPDGTLEFDVERSRTDLLLPQLGLTIRF